MSAQFHTMVKKTAFWNSSLLIIFVRPFEKSFVYNFQLNLKLIFPSIVRKPFENQIASPHTVFSYMGSISTRVTVLLYCIEKCLLKNLNSPHSTYFIWKYVSSQILAVLKGGSLMTCWIGSACFKNVLIKTTSNAKEISWKALVCVYSRGALSALRIFCLEKKPPLKREK